ncbi:MAG: insulinase family protein [Desertifilum sp. SIO1I2]|nr:insulinase family protein [Desertifilum sp. SIO1I2]
MINLRIFRRRGRMRYLWISLLLVSMMVVSQWRIPAIAATARHYTELTFGPLPEIQFPDYTRYQMRNGITVFLIENRELPLVNGTAMFHTGGRLEPADKAGLASLTGEVMRTGGTRQHPPAELNQLLEQRAASVETSIDTSVGEASFSGLSQDTEQILELFAEVLREPAFVPEQLELAKTQRRGEIARRNDNPDGIARREFQKLVYGSSSPYAWTIEYDNLDNIRREDLINFYQQYFHPNNMILGIVGDFDTATMRRLLDEKFGDWQPSPQFQRPALPGVQQANSGGVFVIDQPQLTQSNILLGHLGGQLDSPDHAALTVMNEVLNGFGGRLFNEVRSRQGLAYSVYGYWNPRFDYPGTFIAGGQTRSEATVPFIESVMSEIERIRTSPISSQELQYAKDSVLNSFVFNFQDPSQVLARLMRYEYYDYPADFIFQYQRGVENTTIADIQRVARTYLKPENMVTLVVGNNQAINPPLSSLAQGTSVTSIDITIPERSST